MKFFLEFVACCGLPLTDGSSARAEPAPKPRAEETKSLVKPSRQRRKRGRLSPSGAATGASAEWKPSLGSISEDSAVVGEGGDDRTAGAHRAVKRKSGPGNARVRVRNFNDDYGRASLTAVIPAFSPTPFMF